MTNVTPHTKSAVAAPGPGWVAPFLSLWVGQAFSLVGSRVAQFALVWWLTELTGSATVLATATLVAILPEVLVGPLAGAYVDRWNRRAVMLVADSLVALVSLGLAALFWSGAMQIWHVYLAMGLRALGSSFHWPAMQASTSLMVPHEYLGRVAGLNQTLNGALTIVGPPLGALLMSLLPLYGVMLVDVGTAGLAVLPLLVIVIPQPAQAEPDPDQPGASIWADLRAGLAYIRGWPGLVALIVLAMLLKIALTPAFSLLPLLVSEHFQGGAAHLSLLEAVVGVGIVLGGLLLGAWGGFKRKIYTVLLGLLALAAGLVTLGLTPAAWFWLGLGCAFLIGLTIPLIDGPIIAILQGNVAPEMQGRVFTLMSSLVWITSPFSLALAGPISDGLGLQFWYVAAGLLCALTGLAGYLTPAVVSIEDNVNGGSPARQVPELRRAEGV